MTAKIFCLTDQSKRLLLDARKWHQRANEYTTAEDFAKAKKAQTVYRKKAKAALNLLEAAARSEFPEHVPAEAATLQLT